MNKKSEISWENKLMAGYEKAEKEIDYEVLEAQHENMIDYIERRKERI